MPPSGYVKREANLINQFALSIVERLQGEVAEGKHSDFQAAVAHEIGIIDQELENKELEPTTRGVLQLTRGIYEKIQSVGISEMFLQIINLPLFKVSEVV